GGGAAAVPRPGIGRRGEGGAGDQGRAQGSQRQDRGGDPRGLVPGLRPLPARRDERGHQLEGPRARAPEGHEPQAEGLPDRAQGGGARPREGREARPRAA
ncbi:hypothetical protein THAOC_29964, partial [Thalassiosira oceanica]